MTFEAGELVLPEVTTGMYSGAQTWYEGQVPAGAADFDAQVAENVAAGGSFTPPGDDTWEPVPYGDPGAYDFYQRPIYENMRFENVRIPMGNNGLFRNCRFVGVTFIETEPDCVHENWNYAGAVERIEDPPGSANYVYELKYPGVMAELSDGTPVPDTKVMSNNVRFDGCTFIGSVAGVTPDELAHWRNQVQFSGETRFFVDADAPDLPDQPDAAEIVGEIAALEAHFLEKLRRSSILLPGWSVGMRNFDDAPGADPQDTFAVTLQGAIVAGILDVRGTADIRGTVMMTFRPTADEGPLFYGGHPSAFATTIGWFGADDDPGPGDPGFPGFGRITLHEGFDAPLPEGVPWSLRAAPVWGTTWWFRPSAAPPCE